MRVQNWAVQGRASFAEHRCTEGPTGFAKLPLRYIMSESSF